MKLLRCKRYNDISLIYGLSLSHNESSWYWFFMESLNETKTLWGDPQKISLTLAEHHDLPTLLKLIVTLLVEAAPVALARIWLIDAPHGECVTCRMADACLNRQQCLQLVASAGRPTNQSEDWSRVNGHFSRFPIGVRKVGLIASTGKAIEAANMSELPEWVARPEWIRSENLVAFGGQPLIHRGKVLGVLVVFTREPIGESSFLSLRMIANHAAVAIANARALDEIEALKKRLELENQYLQEEVRRGENFGGLLGKSPAMDSVARQIELVADTDSSVLITGESGTGKEVVAREIHQRSRRSQRPLIKVNCAAIPRELYESEFFGHSKGSFTGAVRDRVGRFELAHGGTLFLDEVGEIPLDLQSKLLRVLQEGELERVGEERTRRVDVRVIAATNRNLRQEAQGGHFRQDLYYRLSVFPIELPPLRDRSVDIPLLAEHFLNALARKLGRPNPRLTLANAQQLQAYDWPGNVRELQHVLERALIVAADGRLRFDGLAPAAKTPVKSLTDDEPERVRSDAEIRQIEITNIQAALRVANGKIYGPGGAAELLGLKPTTLVSRIKALKIIEPIRK